MISMLNNQYRERWLANPLDPFLFMDYVLYLNRIGNINEAYIYRRVKELYKSPNTFSINDWPDIAVCALSAQDAFVRRASIELLANIESNLALAILGYIYHQIENQQERSLCLLSLGLTKNPNTVSLLLYAFTNEPGWALKDDICYALGIIGSELALPFLESVANDEAIDKIVRTQAVSSIGYTISDNTKDILCNIIKKSSLNLDVRKKALNMLDFNNWLEDCQSLVYNLSDDDPIRNYLLDNLLCGETSESK